MEFCATDYRVGISGVHGSGKTTLARYIHERFGFPYIDARVGDFLTSLGVKVGDDMPMYENLEVQYEIAKYLDAITQGSEGFIIDRTPVDVVAYTLDLASRTNEPRCVDLAMEIQTFCRQSLASNFNMVVGLRHCFMPGPEDMAREQRASFDPFYVSRIDALMCGELTRVNGMRGTDNLWIYVLSENIRTVEDRAHTVMNLLHGNLKREVHLAQRWGVDLH